MPLHELKKRYVLYPFKKINKNKGNYVQIIANCKINKKEKRVEKTKTIF